MMVWYIIDSAGSIAAGVLSNVVFNSIYLILVLAPLVCIKGTSKALRDDGFGDSPTRRKTGVAVR
ncbi:MAG: hypothetical protein FD130_2480 [Halothiobacillaceae bacterium]|nr:MAG: hypothetical protein FD130_2480 [Halothiobacillaceae bacterium]